MSMDCRLFVSMLFDLANCVILFAIFIITNLVREIFERNWWSIGWVNKWMENGNFTNTIGLNERIIISFLDHWVNESLAKIISVLEEVDDSSISINEHTHSSSFAEVAVLWLLIWLNRVVVLPSSSSELVTSG